MLPFRNGRSENWGSVGCWLSILLLSIVLGVEPSFAAKPTQKRQKGGTAAASASVSPGEQGLTNIPLPIGHEAKGLVLPDFALEGHLRGRLEASSRQCLDHCPIAFASL